MLSKREWEELCFELNELQDYLFHCADKLAKAETKDSPEKYEKMFNYYISDGWERLVVVMHALEKLGLPKKLKKFDINDEYQKLVSEREVRKNLIKPDSKPKLRIVGQAAKN